MAETYFCFLVVVVIFCFCLQQEVVQLKWLQSVHTGRVSGALQEFDPPADTKKIPALRMMLWRDL